MKKYNGVIYSKCLGKFGLNQKIKYTIQIRCCYITVGFAMVASQNGLTVLTSFPSLRKPKLFRK